MMSTDDLFDMEPDELAAEFVDANERMALALVEIGRALGVPAGEPASRILEAAEAHHADVLHYAALRMALRMVLEEGPLDLGMTITVYGEGDQSVVEQVARLVYWAEQHRYDWSQPALPAVPVRARLAGYLAHAQFGGTVEGKGGDDGQ